MDNGRYHYEDDLLFRKKHPNIPLTIEEQLESYAHCENTTVRHEMLLNAWKHNKEWLGTLLQWTLPAFQNYSMHDVSHCEVVLHNIEMLTILVPVNIK